MPKRRIKEDKPRKRMGKKEILIPPVIIGIATISGLLVMHFFPAPAPINICLKSHHDTFNINPKIEVDVDGQKKLLPDTVGKSKDGKECLRVIHTDTIGNEIHVQFTRPVKLTLDDFMKIYSSDNNTIQVVDNSTGKYIYQNISLTDHNIDYSYYSENQFVKITNLTNSPPLSDTFLGKISLVSK